MKCEFCPQHLQPDWKFCPACGHEVVVPEDDRLTSAGVRYCPDAFEQGPYVFGRAVAENSEFYEVFIRYILTVLSNPFQLLAFRPHIVQAVKNVTGKKHDMPSEHVRWCALSLASDRYFGEKSRAYDWSGEEEEEIKTGWFNLIAPAFLTNYAPDKKMSKKTLTSWVNRFKELHKRDSGPLPACSLCTSKCQYQCEVAQVTQSARIKSDFQAAINRQTAHTFESAAWYCRLLTERLMGDSNGDLSYCLAVHLIKETEVTPPTVTLLSTDAQLILAHKVRGSLEEMLSEPEKPSAANGGVMMRAQVLEVIIRQAMAGAPWQTICAAPMKYNNITVEEVEEEVRRRKRLPS